jgi:hypothetical protein
MKLFELFINCIILQAVQGQLAISLDIAQHSSSLYANSAHNSQFLLQENFLQCAAKLYQYGQTSQQYALAAPSTITITGNSQTLSLSVSTQYGHFSPSINTTTCLLPSCTISLLYNCPSPLSNSNYFDIISLTILPLGTFSYYFNCNIGYNTTYF